MRDQSYTDIVDRGIGNGVIGTSPLGERVFVTTGYRFYGKNDAVVVVRPADPNTWDESSEAYESTIDTLIAGVEHMLLDNDESRTLYRARVDRMNGLLRNQMGAGASTQNISNQHMHHHTPPPTSMPGY